MDESMKDDFAIEESHSESHLNEAGSKRIFKISLRIPITLMGTAVLSSFLPLVLAQAPVNDVVAWPSGLLLLATVLYAALGTSPYLLWEIEPTTGFFLFAGLPKLAIPGMQRVSWVTSACHFVPGIRSAYGISNFWVRSNSVSRGARAQALEKALSQLRCVTYQPSVEPLSKDLWQITPAGFMIRPNVATDSPKLEMKCPSPVARDFLLFAAIDYHAFREWEVRISKGNKAVFNTKDMPPSSIIEVASEEDALYVVAAQMVRRPHSQSPLRGAARRLSDDEYGPYILDLDGVNRDVPICAIDFHSYSPENDKVSATLSELARAYFRVVQYLKQNSTSDIGLSGQIARIEVGQTLWISILGGSILDTGRLTIQNLPGRWSMKDKSADEAFISRVESVLQQLAPYGGTATEFSDLVFSGGISRWSAVPFFIAGLFGQTVVCYFLSVGTSAGIWTSVALANSLYTGRLTDWHSMYYGKSLGKDNQQPGMKMYLPGSPSQELMVIATFDRSTPMEGRVLRSGFALSVFGLIAAILGSIFATQTRNALGFSPTTPTQPWVVYTSVVLCLGTTVLLIVMLAVQQSHERTWWDHSELPTRWMAYTTFPASFAICGLAMLFKLKKMEHLWPVLDALTWLSGAPLGMLENGRLFSADENMLHLVLLNRWMMGAVASSLGSSIK